MHAREGSYDLLTGMMISTLTRMRTFLLQDVVHCIVSQDPAMHGHLGEAALACESSLDMLDP